ncbi:MAG TPA: hypothetical protein VHW00_25475 [Thermoanaerobaculia bacterium]|nr:hypothetical protein [Thermoanaerobaculia bacterium]
MGKQLNDNKLASGRISRALLAISLSASLAAAGCTTNRNPGSGEPIRDGFVRTAPTGGVTGGSEMPTPPPMISSYTGSEALPTASARPSAYVGPAEAAAIMARQQPRVRVLGPSNPGSIGTTGTVTTSELAPTDRRNAEIMYVPPRVTVNSTLDSPATAAYSNDGSAAAAGGGAIIGAVTADGTIIGSAGTTSNATISNATSGTTTTGITTTGTTAASVAPALTPGVLAGTTTATPTVASTPLSTVTSGTSGTVVTSAGTINRNTTGTMTPTTTTTTAGSRLTARRNGGSTTTGTTANARVGGMTTAGASINRIGAVTTHPTATTGNVRILRSASGQITVTNIQ